MNDDAAGGAGDRRDEGDDPESRERDADPADVPVDPGEPSTENAAFVVLGAFLALFAFARIAGLV